jgi:hypothetical protein
MLKGKKKRASIPKCPALLGKADENIHQSHFIKST